MDIQRFFHDKLYAELKQYEEEGNSYASSMLREFLDTCRPRLEPLGSKHSRFHKSRYDSSLRNECNAILKHGPRVGQTCNRILDPGCSTCHFHGNVREPTNCNYEELYKIWECMEREVAPLMCRARALQLPDPSEEQDCDTCDEGKWCEKHIIGYSDLCQSMKDTLGKTNYISLDILKLVSEFLPEKIPCRVKLTFIVSGTDHEGYCSGAESEEIEPFSHTYLRVVDLALDQDLTDVSFLSQFDHIHNGCTTGGSGYCSGESIQTHKCVQCRVIRLNPSGV